MGNVAKIVKPAGRFTTGVAASALAVAIAGCGGGDSASATATQVSLTASSTAVDGGETVALTVSATGAGGNVPYSLTCNGGTLTGSLLVTPVVTADTTIACTATASNANGTTATQNVSIAVRASTATLATPEGQTQLAAGQMAVLQATNLPLTAETYSATLDGAPITLRRVGGSGLAIPIPIDATTGTKRLQVVVGNRTFVYSLAVTAAPTIADPRSVVEGALNDARARTDAMIAASPAAERDAWIERRSQVDAAIGALSTTSAAELQAFARMLVANRATFERGATAVSPACKTAYASLLFDGAALAQAGALFALGGIGVTALVGALNPLLVLGVTAVAAYNYAEKAQNFLGSIGTIATQCIFEKEVTWEESVMVVDAQRSLGAFQTALAADVRFGFSNRQSKTIRFTRVMDLDDSQKGSFQSLAATVRNAISGLAIFQTVTAQISNSLVSERREVIPAAQLSLAGTSNAGISGSATPSSSGLTLAFTANSSITANTDFTFTVNRAGGTPITVPAQLVIALPTAEDAALTINQATPTSSQVTVRGQDRLEIVSQPSKGSVVLNNDGTFRYTPTGDSFGEDRFTYRGVNAEGVSRTATVIITITRRFEGNWAISSRTTTTSQSSPGLCPSENRSLTLAVSKVSDTLYTTAYQGSTVNLTMGSRDDAAGLRGAANVSYAQDGGTTTESLSISVPNSRSMTGSGTFSWRNGQQSCSGTISFTGTKN